MEDTKENKRPRDGELDSSDPSIVRPNKRRRIEDSDFESPNIILPPEIMHCNRYWYQNILNTAFHGWMLAWEDNLQHGFTLDGSYDWWVSIRRFMGTERGAATFFNKKTGRPVFEELVDRQIIAADTKTLSTKESEYWKFEPITSSLYYATAKYYFNTKNLECDIQQGKEIDNQDILIEALVWPEVLKFMADKGPSLLNTSKAMFPFIPSKRDAPKGLKEGIKFHQYQLDAINWMLSVEEESEKEFKYCVLVPWHASKLNVLVSLVDVRFVSPSNMELYFGSVISKGGILADGVGLGKTFEIFGLALSSYTKEKLPDIDTKTGLLNTRATLVVCPNHLHQQWCEQIEKYTDLNVVLMDKDHAKLTYGDIAKADFVIVPSTFIKSKKYFMLGCEGASFGRGGIATRKQMLAEKHLNSITKNKKFAALKEPVLDLFLFNRIIVDEAHEVLADNLVLDLVTCIPKKFGWYVSATPFPSEKLYTAAKIFLEILPLDFVEGKTVGEKYESFVENDIIFNNLIWRNTKDSIHDDYSVPDYEEHLIEIEFTPIEQLLHDHSTCDKLKLCAGQIAIPDLDAKRDAEIDLVKGLETSIEGLKKRNEKNNPFIKREIKILEDDLADPKKKAWHQQFNRSLIQYQYQIRNSEELLEQYEKNLVKKKELLNKWLATEYLMKGKEIRDKKELAHLKLATTRGSKLTKLIEWLQETINKDKDNRFIVFSKYTEFLQRIKEILSENGIKSVSVEGSSANKIKAIQQFKEENIKVIMLSLEKSASGLNLIEANHVVLLDPMDGTVEEARAFEVQALGRAHRQGQDQKVNLVRLIMKNSKEEELYLRNKSSGRDSGANKSGKPMLAKSSSATSLRNLAEFNEE